MLEQFKTYLINLDDQPDRLENSKKVLESINQPFERFPGIKHSRGIVGCGMSHLKLLKRIKPRNLILEDDIELTDFPKNLEEMPRNVDAVYLGVSNYGFVRKVPHGVEGSVLVTQATKDYKRVFNMCSAHAVIYMSEDYIEACQRVAEHCLKFNIPWDLGTASIHRHFNVITPNAPWFYQSEQPELTNFILQV